MATVLNLLDGKTNAVLVMTVQFWDTGLLLYLRPYVDVPVNVSECLGGLTNLLGYLAISTPILLDGVVPQSIFGDYTSMLLVTSATIVSAMISLTGPLMMVARKIPTMLRMFLKCAGSGCACFSPAVLAPGNDAFKNTKGNLQDEIQAMVEEAYMEEEDNAEGLDDDGAGIYVCERAGERERGGGRWKGPDNVGI